MEKNRSVNKIKRRRRLVVFILFLIIILLVIFNIIRKKDYQITYNKNNFTIEETYNKTENFYSFVIKKEETTYFTVLLNKHFFTKKIIYDINEFVTETEKCILINSNKVRFEPLCVNESGEISYHLVSDEMKEKINYVDNFFGEEINETYFNILTYNTVYQSFYIWNYHGFYVIDKDKQEEITLFNKDIYTPSLIAQVDNYLFVPDYEANYYFNKAYVIDMNSGKVNTWNLSDSIYFDSVILGVYEDSFYLVDKHEKKEWKINIKKQQMEQVGSESNGGIIYQNGFIDVTMNKLVYQDYQFTGILPFTYEINNGLYLLYKDYKRQLIKESPTKIIKIDNDVVYYLKNDSLYVYMPSYGEIKLMNYFEWNFNSNNVIFIS